MFINLLHLGRVPYPEALGIQQQVIAARKQNRIADTLLLLEHPPVITLGRNAHRSNILATDQLLAARGVQLHEINRGGDVTYHGPGQLIGYPIVDLRGDLPGRKGPHLGPVEFVRLLEEVLIRTCGDFGVLTQRLPGLTGVWTLAGGSIPEKKIAAIGIHVSQAVTSHGFALNVSTDLRDFDLIVSCGLAGRQVTSLELEVDPSRHASESTTDAAITMEADITMEAAITTEAATNAVSRNFGRIFDRQMLWCESLEALLSPVTAAGPASPMAPIIA